MTIWGRLFQQKGDKCREHMQGPHGIFKGHTETCVAGIKRTRKRTIGDKVKEMMNG